MVTRRSGVAWDACLWRRSQNEMGFISSRARQFLVRLVNGWHGDVRTVVVAQQVDVVTVAGKSVGGLPLRQSRRYPYT